MMAEPFKEFLQIRDSFEAINALKKSEAKEFLDNWIKEDTSKWDKFEFDISYYSYNDVLDILEQFEQHLKEIVNSENDL